MTWTIPRATHPSENAAETTVCLFMQLSYQIPSRPVGPCPGFEPLPDLLLLTLSIKNEAPLSTHQSLMPSAETERVRRIDHPALTIFAQP